MATGRQLIERAAREPMTAKGWQPRGAGLFTRSITDRFTGLVDIGTASEHHPRGVAVAHPSVGLRDEVVPPIVAQLSGVPDARYRQVTLSTNLGYVSPDATFRGWVVSEANAAEVGLLMATAVEDFGLPFLTHTAQSPQDFLRSFERFFLLAGSSGVCRRAVVLEPHDRRADALALLDQQMASVAGQVYPYAVELAPVLLRTRAWISSRAERS